MKIYLVNCASEKFYKRQKKQNESALKFGIDKVFSYTDDILKQTEFYEKNKETFSHKKGGGYWIWKPYILLEAMKKINYGDILFYVSAGAEIISDVKPLVDLCKKNGIVFFNAVGQNKFYTKRDCFILMGCDAEEYWDANHIMSGYEVYTKNERSIQFLEEFLKFAQVPQIIDDEPSKVKDFSEFKGHRHDQSILSNLVVKYGVKRFRNPSQGGNHLKKQELRKKGEWLVYPYVYSNNPDINSHYPTIFHNRRSATNFRLFLIKLHSKLPLKLKLWVRKFVK